MSMRTSFAYGYGFYCDCSEEKLIDFIKKHKETFCKSDAEKELFEGMFDCTKNKYNLEDLEDFFEGYECESTGVCGIGAAIANIMSRETGVRFDYCASDDVCDTRASVMFGSGYPWQLTEVEKSLTEEKLDDICEKYASELGIDTSENVGYLALEYCG